MELSRPVVVQHRGYLTLTLNFQGQILKMLYLRNGRVDSLGMKGMLVGYDVGCTMVLTLGHGVFLCLDQLLPDSHHCSGSLDLK